MIRLFLNNDTWFADFSDAFNSKEIFRLFGTYEIPTAFTKVSSAAKVVHNISLLNPTQTVVIRSL